jgi:hypothetical protein
MAFRRGPRRRGRSSQAVQVALAKARTKIRKCHFVEPTTPGCLPYALLLAVALGVSIAGESGWGLALLVLTVAGWVVTNWIR